MADRDPRRSLWRGIRAAPTPTWGEALLLLAFAVAVWRNKWIADDGYIYLTYVDRVLDGHGAVFNPGEPVEGYTSTLWFGLLAVLRFVVRVGSLETLTLLVSMALALGAAMLLVTLERRAVAARAGWAADTRCAGFNIPLALAAGTYAFVSFATSGLETPLLMAWCSCAALAVWSRAPHPLWLAALAGVAPLVRPDLALLAGAIAGWAMLRASGRLRWLAIAVAVGPTALVTVVRVGAYGQLVPNTYYAKTDTGHGFADGVAYFRDAALPYALQWLAVIALAVAVASPLRRWAAGAAWRESADPASIRSLALLGGAALTGVQVLAVGGDFMHGRFWIAPWWLALASLAGAGSRLIDRGSAIGGRARTLAVVGCVAVWAVQSWSTSLQRLYFGDELFGIGDIADEQAYYELTNPQIHDLTPRNQSPLFAQGRALSEASRALGVELGVAAGAIGQIAYGGATGPGEVYVYDRVGLTRLEAARLRPLADARVGHARIAPDVLVALHPRVDFHSPYFEGYADAFGVTIGQQRLVLVDLDLIDDLARTALITADDEQRMREYLSAALAGPEVDANFVTFVAERLHGDERIDGRLAELAEIEAESEWRRWLESTERQRALLDTDGCGDDGWIACLGRAIDRHRSAVLEVDVVEPDLVAAS